MQKWQRGYIQRSSGYIIGCKSRQIGQFIHSFIHGCYKNGRTECSMNPVEKLGFNIEFDRLLDKAKCILSSRESFHTKLNSEDEKSMRKIFSIGTRVAKDLKIQCRLRKKTTTKTAKKSQSKQFQCYNLGNYLQTMQMSLKNSPIILGNT